MKNIMFDLYGTLIDIHTEEGTKEFWESIVKYTNSNNTYESMYKKYKDVCRLLSQEVEEIEILDAFKALFPNKNPRLVAKYFREQSTIYIKLYYGVKILLKELHNEGYNVYLLSNAQSAFTTREMKKLKIYNLFDGIAISSDYGVKKPNKEFYKRAMENFKIIPSETIMIGNDYYCDIKPARELGLGAIFIKSNLTPKNQLKYKGLIGFYCKELLKTIKNM